MSKKRNLEEPELRIRGISPKTKQLFQNIADNMGIPLGEYLKTKILWLLETTPEHLKREPRKD